MLSHEPFLIDPGNDIVFSIYRIVTFPSNELELFSLKINIIIYIYSTML